MEIDAEECERNEQDIFSETYLLRRPLLQAISSEQPCVLLIDEIDKVDFEFEAMLLELLSEFQITIPELGTIRAANIPYVFLTSNATRELSEALKRRCLFLYLDFPCAELEERILKLKVPGISDMLAAKVASVVHHIRQVDLKKLPSIAESIDWAAALLELGVDDLDPDVALETLNVIIKHREDLEKLERMVRSRKDLTFRQTPLSVTGR